MPLRRLEHSYEFTAAVQVYVNSTVPCVILCVWAPQAAQAESIRGAGEEDTVISGTACSGNLPGGKWNLQGS